MYRAVKLHQWLMDSPKTRRCRIAYSVVSAYNKQALRWTYLRLSWLLDRIYCTDSFIGIDNQDIQHQSSPRSYVSSYVWCYNEDVLDLTSIVVTALSCYRKLLNDIRLKNINEMHTLVIGRWYAYTWSIYISSSACVNWFIALTLVTECWSLYRKSLKRFDAFTVAMACLCLASKIEEKPKYLHDVSPHHRPASSNAR